MNLGTGQCLNTLAVDYIVHGEYRLASEVLEAAIAEWGDCARLTPIEAGHDHKVSVYFADYFDSTREAFVVHPALFECEEAALSEDSQLTEQQHSCVATILFFNLGLCFHLAGLRNMEDNKALLLTKARMAYERVYLKALSSLQAHGSHAVCPSVLRAICQNAAHCSLELTDFQRSHFWNQELIWAIRVDFPIEGDEEIEVDRASRIFFTACVLRNQFCGTGARAA